MLRVLLFFFINGCTSFLLGQSTISGTVVDTKGQPIFAASVYLKSNTSVGTTTDFDGIFKITASIKENPDNILIVSSIGYETAYWEVSKLLINKSNTITLVAQESKLEEIILTYKDPISEQFSVNKLDKLDIYLNPLSNGDPLKAITGLPSSTNTNENSNPTLRGSSAVRSAVVLNGVPIINPVKNSQVNSVGNFSLFNTELIHKQYVYASNPPLTYGNSSAGLIEIESISELKDNQISISAGLANVGLFVSQRTASNNFLQVYGNWQFSKLFLELNASGGFRNIDHFRNKDLGLNYHHTINENTSFNTFNYIIDESYSAETQNFTYRGNQQTSTLRYFNISNFKKKTTDGLLSINVGLDIAFKKFNFGNIDSKVDENQLFTSINYKHRISPENTLQIGASSNYNSYNFNTTIPEFFFSQAPSAPSLTIADDINNHAIEGYAYDSHKFSEKTIGALGLRFNIPTGGQPSYFSYQGSLRYQPNNSHSFLLSGGRYYNYSLPAFFDTNYRLLDSYQGALDYSFQKSNFSISSAIYYKEETGDSVTSQFISFDKNRIIGVEFLSEYFLGDDFKVSLSNTFLNQKIRVDNAFVDAQEDLDYFIKATVSYTNPKYVNATFNYVGRPGTRFTPVISSTFNTDANAFDPTYSSAINSNTLNNYHSINLSLSRIFKVNEADVIIGYLSANNLFNRRNQRDRWYSSDYSTFTFDHLQPFTVYFGCMYKLGSFGNGPN